MLNTPHTRIKNIRELKSSGWISRPVKEEMRENLIRKIKRREPLFPGIYGYDSTVIPQLRHAILARHDVLLLGLRGQAKTRLLRSLVNFLDEFMPIIEGSELNDDPYNPLSPYGKQLLAEHGDNTPVSWVHRSSRYVEKLATPDTTVADLIGDIDPIKAATRKLDLSSEHVIHYGLIPRSNRGLFAINELPDLQPRIQVALLNIMQERDIQIRGFNLRFPLDVALVFSANPEDYTNRGNIITPLKDRIDAQIITHYPKDIDTGMRITEQEAWIKRGEYSDVSVPFFIKQIVEQIAVEARQSEYVDQKSGVSARLTITVMEHIVSAAENRMLMTGEESTSVRISDLYHAVPAITGKLELVYEGEQEGAAQVANHLVGKAINTIFKTYFPDPQKKQKSKAAAKESASSDDVYSKIITWFSKGNTLELPDVMASKEYGSRLDTVEGLKELVQDQFVGSDPERHIMMDFVIDALHQNSMLGRTNLDEARAYSDMLGSMLTNLSFDDEDDDLGSYDR
jgi:magnesium chelatase subunit I